MQLLHVEGVGEEVMLLILGLLVFIALVIYLCIKQSGYTHGAEQPPVQVIDASDNSVIERIRNERSNPSLNTHLLEPAGDCPICLQSIELLVVTSCAHSFCAGCIIRCWSYRHAVQFLHCPCCRQEVSFLHEAFSRDLSTIPEASRTRAADLAVQVGEYNRRFSGQPRSLSRQIADLPLLLQWLVDEIVNGRGLWFICNARLVLFFLVMISYTISPIDAVPEAAFGVLGLLDDLLLVLVFIIYATSIFRQRMATIHQDRTT